MQVISFYKLYISIECYCNYNIRSKDSRKQDRYSIAKCDKNCGELLDRPPNYWLLLFVAASERCINTSQIIELKRAFSNYSIAMTLFALDA